MTGLDRFFLIQSKQTMIGVSQETVEYHLLMLLVGLLQEMAVVLWPMLIALMVFQLP